MEPDSARNRSDDGGGGEAPGGFPFGTEGPADWDAPPPPLQQPLPVAGEEPAAIWEEDLHDGGATVPEPVVPHFPRDAGVSQPVLEAWPTPTTPDDAGVPRIISPPPLFETEPVPYTGVAVERPRETAAATGDGGGEVIAHDGGTGEPERRQFVKKALAVCVGGVVAGIPAAAGVIAFTSPLRRGGAEAQFIDIAPLDALPTNGVPRMFRVMANKEDAWNRQENVPVGKVFIKRNPDGSVVAFNALCPHAGCNVDAREDGSFLCPCHNSGFNPDGTLADQSVSPRGLDTLEVDAEALKQGMIRVKFQNFRAATHDRVPV